ncbi:MAG: hypothetical protein LC679_06845 [Intrasporangiaceae bacterium]|nr:hypothetical protein [Intrasporangiaceae bacterium]
MMWVVWMLLVVAAVGSVWWLTLLDDRQDVIDRDHRRRVEAFRKVVDR